MFYTVYAKPTYFRLKYIDMSNGDATARKIRVYLKKSENKGKRNLKENKFTKWQNIVVTLDHSSESFNLNDTDHV